MASASDAKSECKEDTKAAAAAKAAAVDPLRLKIDRVHSVLGWTYDDKSKCEEEVAVLDLSRLRIGSSRKKLLVFGINCLSHTFFNGATVTVPSSRKPDGFFRNKIVFKRLYCDEFLQFCFERFEVAIWASATKRNVEGVLPYIMGKFQSRLLFIWNQTDCTDSGFKTRENEDKPLFLKELKKIWNGTYLLHNCLVARFSPSNTLLIDSPPYKALLNPPNTGIFPDPYMVEQEDDVGLGARGSIRKFLEGLADADEVPSYVAAHPVGQPAITSKHPDWKYYSKIISRLSDE